MASERPHLRLVEPTPQRADGLSPIVCLFLRFEDDAVDVVLDSQALTVGPLASTVRLSRDHVEALRGELELALELLTPAPSENDPA